MSESQSAYNTQVMQVRPTQPFPPDASKPTTYIWCASPNAKMHREDGMPLDFHRCIHATNNRYSVEYFEREIANGHPEIRWARPEEVESYLFQKDPAGYTRAKTIEEMSADMDARLAQLVTAQLKKHGVDVEVTVDDVREATTNIVNDDPQPPPALAGNNALAALQAKLQVQASAVSTADLPHSA